MTKWFVGQDRVFTYTIDNNGTPSDPATIAFLYKEGRLGAWTSVTPAKQSTGVYTATVTPQYGGGIYWRFATTGPNTAYEGCDYCKPSEFSYYCGPQAGYDYWWSR